jgi:HK97 family phage portal protein
MLPPGTSFNVYNKPYSPKLGLVDKQGSPEEMLKAFRALTFACIHVRAKEVANAGRIGIFKLVRETSGGKFKEVPRSHPLVKLMRNPNPDMTRWMLWYLSMAYTDLIGNSYWYVAENKMGLPAALWPVPSDIVKIIPGEPKKKQSMIKEYELDWGAGGKETVPEKRMIHIRHPNPSDPYFYGGSLVMRAAHEVDIDYFITDHQRKFFQNDANPAGLVTFPEILDETTRKAFEEHWNVKFKGQPGQIGFLEGGAEYTPIVNQRELDYLQSVGVNRKTIQAVFGVPDSKLMIEENIQARATMETMDYNFQKETVDPLLSMIDEQLTKDLAQKYFDDDLRFVHDSVIPKDRRTEAELETMRLTSGTMTINEVREKYGEEGFEGGDEPLVGIGYVPLSAVVEGIDVNQFSPGEGEGEEEDGDDDKKQAKPKRKDAPIPEAAKKARWEAHERLRRTEERRHSLAYKRIFVGIATDVLERIRTSGEKAFTREITADAVVFDLNEWLVQIRRVVGRQAFLSMQRGFDLFKRQYQVGDVAFPPNDPQVMAGLAQLGLKTKTVLQTMKKDLVAQINEGIRLKEDSATIAKRVSRFFKGTNNSRAMRIARTNTNYAVNAGTDIAAAASGIFTHKIWVTQRDPKVRHLHVPMDGVTILLDEKFHLDNDDILSMPGDPEAQKPESVVNCRCTLFHIKEKE